MLNRNQQSAFSVNLIRHTDFFQLETLSVGGRSVCFLQDLTSFYTAAIHSQTTSSRPEDLLTSFQYVTIRLSTLTV